jgi:tRNA (guanine-N7-)-methyltransferase
MTPEDIIAAEPGRRRVRSFVRREGRLTRGQLRALDAGLPRFGIPAGEEPIDFVGVFGRRAPVTLEIGFGNGESLAQQAQAQPERDFIGVEVHRPGVGHLLGEIERRGLENVRVLVDDAVNVLERRTPPSSLDAVQIFFPDPWHKKRHHKRRLIQPAFLRLVASRLKPGGALHLATDWRDYAEHMSAALAETRDMFEPEGAQPVASRPAHRPETRFERRGHRLGHVVQDFLYRRRIPPPIP